LAIFLTAVLLVLLRPIPAGPAVLAVLVAAALLGVTEGKGAVAAVYAGLSCSAFWIITSAFVITIAIVRSGLGHRIAYALISKVGGSSLGLGYALTFSNYAISPATLSLTARGVGIAIPIARGICTAFKGPRLSKYLYFTSSMATYTTALGFMTASTSGPIIAASASGILGVEISWFAWAIAALPATLTLLLLQPWLIHKLYPPEPALSNIPNAKRIAKNKLGEMGPLSCQEKITIAVFGLVIALWATELLHRINAAIIGLLGMVVLMVTNVLKAEDLRGINFDILFALAGLYSLTSIVAASGGFDWIAQTVACPLSGLSPAIFIVLFGVLLCYLHAPFMVTSAMALSVVPPHVCDRARSRGSPNGDCPSLGDSR